MNISVFMTSEAEDGRSSMVRSVWLLVLLTLLFSTVGAEEPVEATESADTHTKLSDQDDEQVLDAEGKDTEEGGLVEANTEDAQPEVQEEEEEDDGQADFDKAQAMLNSHQYWQVSEWFTKAADKGHGPAMNMLGMLYLRGYSVERDNTKAFDWFRRAVEAGFLSSNGNIGYMYEKGMGVEVDNAMALQHFLEYSLAVEASSDEVPKPFLDAHTGKLLMEVGGRDAEALKWFERAVEHGDSNKPPLEALFGLSQLYEDGAVVELDLVKSSEYLQSASAQGSVEAMAKLAGIAYTAEEPDYGETYRLVFRAAREGHAESQIRLGFLYASGRGVGQDFKMAKYWWQQASYAPPEGMFVAEVNLGALYMEGLGVDQDNGEAKRWLGKAAEKEKSETLARSMLGDLYEREEDFNEAHAWYKLAAEQGDETASKKVIELLPKLTTKEEASTEEQEEQQQEEESKPM